MELRSPNRQRRLVFAGLLLSALGCLSPLLEHHAIDRDRYPGAAGSEVSVAATHAGASQHCEASTTETQESCVACLLHRRVAGGHLPELPPVDLSVSTCPVAAVADLSPCSALLPPAGGRAPPAA